ncbi:MAG: MFS transporter [Crocinitomicaceae bacterium]|nr:MFS transporter [Crocinitomicaceae bacterium]|tara:strand:+ start:1086 stop:2561 length:1476 start_codon:yes stop_codon:yes gene_type:complete
MTDSNIPASGHPKGLYTLFFSEMWERFCYYGMRVLLTLFLVKSLLKGDSEASLIYGAYTALIYAAPVLGGRMADQFLGYRYAILLGAVLMAIGEFLILGGTESFMLYGMGALIVGNGFFKANISTIVGKLYSDNDPRRDSGFTIFYIGINIGALLATTVVAFVGETYGFEYGFGLAGAGMLAGLSIFWLGRDNYSAAPGLDITEAGMKQVGPLKVYQLISLGSLALIPLCYFLISQNEFMTYLLTGLFVLVAASLIRAGIKEGPMWRDRMIALVIFMLINVVFWACFEQAGTSLTLFADRNVSRDILGWTMPASMTQFFNPAFIIIFGSIFSVMWVKLDAIGKNPSIPMKFALGILQLGAGFLITLVGLQFADEQAMVPLLTLVFLYLLHTTGELFLSPIGLSMVTKLAPKNIAGTAMGGWFLSFAIANYAGGIIASLTGGHGDTGETLTASAGLAKYTDVFSTIGMVLVAFAVLIAVLNKPLNKLMHGVK